MDETVAAVRPRPREYPRGLAWDTPPPTKSVGDLFDDAARTWPDHPFLDFLGHVQTYGEVAQEIAEVAGGMRQQGIGPGSRVGLFLPNSPYYVVALFAALRCGATVVHFSTLLAEAELATQLDDSRVEILITLDLARLLGRYAGVFRASRLRHVIVCNLNDCLPFGKRLLTALLARDGRIAWEEDDLLLRWDRLCRGPDSGSTTIDPTREAAAILYTAGTTGQPRGAMLSHANLAANAAQLAMWFTTADPGEERLVAVLPFFHAFGLTAVLLFGITLGAEIVLLPRFEPRGFLRMLRRTRPTILAGVPSLFAALPTLPGARHEDFASLKVCISGGDALPAGVRERFEAFTDVSLTQGYGLTECAPVVSCGNPLAHCERPGSVGLPLPATEVEIRDPEGIPLHCGAIGEIYVRGPQVMLGYAGRYHETISVLHDNWLRTGDLGRLDADGYLWVVGRLRDVIVTSGYKIYPHHIEETLLNHSAIAEAAVVGVPDARAGAVPVAHLVLRPGKRVDAAELRAYLAPMLSRHETPRRFLFHDRLPRTSFGKIQRDVLASAS